MGSNMSQDPNRFGPSGEPPSELPAIDQAMLLALSHRPRGGAPLTIDQESLLDQWVAGSLPPAEADRAADLTKRNGFAAERVLERRLIEAAHEGPAVPAALAARVLQIPRPNERAAASAGPIAAVSKSFWSILSGWQWSGLGAAVAATLVVAVVGLRMWQEPPKTYKTMQFAMVTIDDRAAFGPRVRSLQPQPAKDGFADYDIPADLIRRSIAGAAGLGQVEATEWATFLPTTTMPGGATQGPTQVLIDRTLAERSTGDWKARSQLPVRVYDLADPRWAAIRNQVGGAAPAQTRLLLVVPRL